MCFLFPFDFNTESGFLGIGPVGKGPFSWTRRPQSMMHVEQSKTGRALFCKQASAAFLTRASFTAFAMMLGFPLLFSWL
jgi:hypothetical protein